MTISDLKFGDIITFKDKTKNVFCGDKLCDETGGYVEITSLSKTLTCDFEDDYSIMKIQRYVPVMEAGTIDINTGKKEHLYELQTIYERKEEILDEKEKEWLRYFIKSTKIKNCIIRKWLGASGKNEYLEINYDVFNYEYNDLRHSCMFLPIFEKGTMYKGMELNKKYILEELGL